MDIYINCTMNKFRSLHGTTLAEVTTNKNIKNCFFKSSENFQKKRYMPDTMSYNHFLKNEVTPPLKRDTLFVVAYWT